MTFEELWHGYPAPLNKISVKFADGSIRKFSSGDEPVFGGFRRTTVFRDRVEIDMYQGRDGEEKLTSREVVLLNSPLIASYTLITK